MRQVAENGLYRLVARPRKVRNHVQSAAERSDHIVSPQRELFSGRPVNTDIRFVLTGLPSGTTVASRRAFVFGCLDFSGVTILIRLSQEQRGPFARTKSPIGRVPTLAWWLSVRKLLRSLPSGKSVVLGNLLVSRWFLQLDHCALVLGLRDDAQCGSSPS